jgi:hypothetical protein
MADDKIPLNEVLNAIDKRDFNWYSELTPERKKKFSSWLFLRYASSVKGKSKDDALLNTNEFVNKHYGDIYKHEELIWKLLCLTSTGKKEYHEWIKAPNSRVKTDKISQFVKDIFPTMKADDLDLFLKLNNVNYMKQMAVDMGLTEKEIDDIFGKTKKKRSKK